MATVLTSAGEAWVTDKLREVTQTLGDWIHWGSGTGTPSKASTGLFGPETEARVKAVISSPAANITRWVASITAAAAKTITNAGNFTASTAGTLIVHGSFTGISLAAGDRIEFTVNLQIT